MGLQVTPLMVVSLKSRANAGLHLKASAFYINTTWLATLIFPKPVRSHGTSLFLSQFPFPLTLTLHLS
jgi:hypothetical protein